METYKRHTAYKTRIGELLSGKHIKDGERLKALEIIDKQVSRVNIIANVIDKFIQEGEKKFASLTLDDGSGQIKLKTFGEEADKFQQYSMGDTLLVIGLVRLWNQEIYLTPEILKKKDPSYLLLRKLEIDAASPKAIPKEERLALKDKMLEMIKSSEKEGGIDIDKIIMHLKEKPESINQEIKELLKEGIIYEPRPGKLRYLG